MRFRTVPSGVNTISLLIIRKNLTSIQVINYTIIVYKHYYHCITSLTHHMTTSLFAKYFRHYRSLSLTHRSTPYRRGRCAPRPTQNNTQLITFQLRGYCRTGILSQGDFVVRRFCLRGFHRSGILSSGIFSQVFCRGGLVSGILT